MGERVNVFQNGEVPAEVVARQRAKEKKLVPLRINSQTVILVPRKHKNEAYRQQWLEKFRYQDEQRLMVCKKEDLFTENQLRHWFCDEGLSRKEVVRLTGVSSSTIGKYLKKFGIEVK